MSYLIRYDYPGTTNGQPVGAVYVERIPWAGEGVYSYTRDPQEATVWDTAEAAEAEARGKHWPDRMILALEECPRLDSIRPL